MRLEAEMAKASAGCDFERCIALREQLKRAKLADLEAQMQQARAWHPREDTPWSPPPHCWTHHHHHHHHRQATASNDFEKCIRLRDQISALSLQ